MKKIIVTGNVGREPEVRYTPNGTEFTVFSLGVSSGTKDHKKTDWFEISCNGKTADVVKEHVHKGTRLLIEGSPSINTWIKDGKAAGSIRIAAVYIEIIGGISQTNIAEDTQHEVESIATDIPF